jgi:hypothetical protein
MAVSKRLRFEVLKRDNHTCRYCGRTPNEAKITIDHVTPVSLGGSDDPSNLVACCADCNSGKSSTPPASALVADVGQSTLRWADALKLAAERAAEAAKENRAARAEIIDRFECVWTAYWVEDPRAADTSTKYRHPGRLYAPRPADWVRSVEQFLAAGLTMNDLVEAVTTAMRNSSLPIDEVWRYFCGVSWSVLRERQSIARQILDAGEV